jgi:hypothetical protein
MDRVHRLGQTRAVEVGSLPPSPAHLHLEDAVLSVMSLAVIPFNALTLLSNGRSRSFYTP